MNEIMHEQAMAMLENNIKIEELTMEIKSKIKGLVETGVIKRDYGSELFSEIKELTRRSYIAAEDAPIFASELEHITGSFIPVIDNERLFSEERLCI
ncbi:MAG: hypothetical protein HRT47_01385 [Candidatus Caenarcaniphilales bacterium]|nr:hypothetical protein [Candidatus Caenarcaniphilales bacterium]